MSLEVEGQERFTRLRASTLGNGYRVEDIQAIIEGRTSMPESRAGASQKVNLMIDIQSRMRTGKGPAYEWWAKIFNLKQMVATLQYLQENDLLEYEQLEKKATEVIGRFHTLSDSIKATESAIRTNLELKTAVVDYAKTRSVFEGYKATKYSRKYLTEHEADIATYRVARATMDRILNGAKLPKMDTLKAEYQTLLAKKKAAYGDYRATKKDMQELITAKANIDRLFSLTDTTKNKEIER